MVAPSITLGSNNGHVGAVVTVSGANFTAGKTISSFTFAGGACSNTCIGQVVAGNGSWSGTFVVPASGAGAQTVSAGDNKPESATASYTVTPAIVYSVSSGIAGTVVTAIGSGFTIADVFSAFTIGGVTPLNTVVGTTVGAAGAWTAEFTVPDIAAGAKATVATDADDGAVSGPNFTVTQSIIVDPSGVGTHTVHAAASITTTFSASANANFIVAIVAWDDTGGTLVSSVADNLGTHLTWVPRGKAKEYWDTSVDPANVYKMQEFVAANPGGAIAGKTLTVTFSGAITGYAALAVFGTDYTGQKADANPGFPIGFVGTISGGTSSSCSVTTHFGPCLLIAATLLCPHAAITPQLGWDDNADVNATDFELEIQSKPIELPVNNYTVSETFAQGNYNNIILIDAILEYDATDNPYTEKYIQAVTGDGTTTDAPVVVTRSGNTITYDYSGGAATTKTETHTSEYDPTCAPPTNENDE
jgi:hypothetical protein